MKLLRKKWKFFYEVKKSREISVPAFFTFGGGGGENSFIEPMLCCQKITYFSVNYFDEIEIYEHFPRLVIFSGEPIFHNSGQCLAPLCGYPNFSSESHYWPLFRCWKRSGLHWHVEAFPQIEDENLISQRDAQRTAHLCQLCSWLPWQQISSMGKALATTLTRPHLGVR